MRKNGKIISVAYPHHCFEIRIEGTWPGSLGLTWSLFIFIHCIFAMLFLFNHYNYILSTLISSRSCLRTIKQSSKKYIWMGCSQYPFLISYRYPDHLCAFFVHFLLYCTYMKYESQTGCVWVTLGPMASSDLLAQIIEWGRTKRRGGSRWMVFLVIHPFTSSPLYLSASLLLLRDQGREEEGGGSIFMFFWSSIHSLPLSVPFSPKRLRNDIDQERGSGRKMDDLLVFHPHTYSPLPLGFPLRS